jgi:hypothetical protein
MRTSCASRTGRMTMQLIILSVVYNRLVIAGEGSDYR